MEIQLFNISKNDRITWVVAGFTHSHKNGSFVDLVDLNCPLSEDNAHFRISYEKGNI